MKLLKNLGKIALISYLGLYAGCGAIQRKVEKSPEFLAFPNQIPKARVEKYYVPGSERILVHLRDSHFLDEMTRKHKRQVMQIQDDWYEALSYLIENHSLRRIYVEGGDEKGFEAYKQKIKELDRMKREYGKMIQRTEENVNALREIVQRDEENLGYKFLLLQHENLLEKVREDYKKIVESRFMNSAIFRLYLEGRVDIFGVEDTEIKRKCDELWNKYENNEKVCPGEFLDTTTDKREDGVLRIIGENEDRRIFLMFGASHAFGGRKSCGRKYNLEDRFSHVDNIAVWNKENPDNQFSLIEVTPESHR